MKYFEWVGWGEVDMGGMVVGWGRWWGGGVHSTSVSEMSHYMNTCRPG
jgi:hypothetical protein